MVFPCPRVPSSYIARQTTLHGQSQAILAFSLLRSLSGFGLFVKYFRKLILPDQTSDNVNSQELSHFLAKACSGTSIENWECKSTHGL